MPSLFDQLQAEWPVLARRPDTAVAAAPACTLLGVTDPDRLVAAVRRRPAAETDPALAALAADAPGSQPAARVLLQLLLPGTCRLAGRWWALGDADERAAAAVTAVYARIRGYRIDRRPTHIAANILLDANQDLRRLARRATRYATTITICDPAVLTPPAEPAVSAAAELADVLADAVAAGRVRADDAELVAVTRIGGTRIADLAESRGIPARTLHWRRRNAEDALVAARTAA
jgi:hypothetical protein